MSGILKLARPTNRSFVSAYITVRNATTAKLSATAQPDFDSAKPFNTIPGPTPLPMPSIGNFWRFLPFGGYADLGLHGLHLKLFEDYGSIVRLRGIGKNDLIFVYQPEDVEKVFRAEGSWPIRLGGDSLDYYRRHVRPDIYKFRGVFTTEGDEWKKNRTVLNQPMMRPRNLDTHHQRIQKIGSQLIERMRTLRDENMELPKDFRQELNRWAVEYIVYVSLDTKLGLLEPNLPPNNDGDRLIKAAIDFFDVTYRLEVLPSLWELYSTSDYKKMLKAQDIIVEIAMKYITPKLKEIESRPEGAPEGISVLESLLKSSKDKSVAIYMVIDMMTAGVDTTSNMTAIAMHHLAHNPEVQDKLYQELKTFMPNKSDPLPEDYVTRIPYLKACQKESQRMCPIVAGNSRKIAKDVVLSGYQIPKGSRVICGQMVMCKQESNFTDAGKFMPERWLKNQNGKNESVKTPFAFLPFGFGPRMCIGRKFVDQELDTILAMIFRNFKVSFQYGPLEMETTLLRRPKTPLRFKIEERKD